MKATLETKALQKALGDVLGAVERRNTIPVLSCVLLKAEGDRLALTATDMELEIRIDIPAEVGAEGAACLPAALLGDIARKAGAPKIALERGARNKQMALKAGRAAFRLPVTDSADFPTFEWKGALDCVLPAEQLRRLIDATRFAISTDAARYFLNGVHLDRAESGGLRAVATNGHVLGMADVAFSGAAPNVILPRKAVLELRKLVEEDGDVAFGISESRAAFARGDARLLTKLIDGIFPDYRRVIPANPVGRALLSGRDLSGAVDRVRCVTESRTRRVRLRLEAGAELEIEASGESGEGRESVAMRYEGPKMAIALNGDYLMDAIAEMEEVALGVTAPHIPVTLAAPDGTRLALVMPMGDAAA